MKAPLELPNSLQWLGRPPLWLDPGCRGHVTPLVLWRLGCGHGLEAIADVARAVVEFAGRPVVGLAVHVPCLPAERDPARVVRALHGLPLAAAIDGDHALVQQLTVTALPVLVLLDARGVVRFQGIGVPHPRRLADAITVLLDEAEHRGELAAMAWAPAPLRAPGGARGLFAHGDQLWLADANTHRLHALDRQARVVRTIGSGLAGRDDGTASEASFQQPVAMVVQDEVLLVADAAAHTLRAIELPSGLVSTWCGTGRRSTDRTGGAYGRDQGLCTPVALCRHDGAVVIAQQQAHQLWQFDPMTRAAAAWFGNGERQARAEHELVLETPAAIAADGETIWVAEAERGIVRTIDLGHGQGRVVWEGLQRPVAILRHEGRTFVADAWQPAVLVARDGEPLRPLVTAANGLVEPVALAWFAGRLWIADAGRSELLAVEELGNLAGQWMPVLDLPAVAAVVGKAPLELATVLPRLRLREHSDVALRLRVPAGAAADGGRWSVDVEDEAEPRLAVPCRRVVTASGGVVEVLLAVGDVGVGALRVRLGGDGAVVRHVVPIEVAVDGELRAELG
jgi:hypothetical protein